MSARIALGLVSDLFFRAKIDAVAELAGFETAYASDLESAARQCAAHHPAIAIVFVDLSDTSFPASETATIVRANAPDAALIGFASHVDLKPLNAARAAGFSRTLSRSEFTSRLADFFR
jgi:DNA-binding NarL/FixJ family response regulator